MSDRDDFAELISSARSVTKCPSFYFNGRIRYGTKGEKVEERLLCMDSVRVYICSVKIPVKIESHFNILSIKLIEKSTDYHVIIETDEKQVHSLYGLHDKSSLQPFLIVLIRNLHAVLPQGSQTIVEIRPENEYDKLLRLSNEYLEDNSTTSSKFRPCGGFSHRYECACDFHQVQCCRPVQSLVDSVFAHRTSREFTFREFEALTQKDWIPIMGALRHNEWFTKITIENIKLSSENIDELCVVIRLCKAIEDLRLVNCGLRHDFCTRFAQCLPVTHTENLDLSYNALEDKGLIALSTTLHQRKLPLRSLNLQSCSITHKSLHPFNTALINNNYLLKNLQILNLSGNRIKEENCITILFSNTDNILEELHLSDIEFSLETFFHVLATMTCKLRRLFISSTKSSVLPAVSGGVKLFFTKNQSLEILQLSNANLSIDFLRELCDGLHSNIHLNKLDLRLSGNQLEAFIHEHATRFATIPCLSALDITGCDLDNEIPILLGELKKNRKLKSLHLGKNFNNIKTKNMQRTIMAMKELVLESELEYLSIADSRLKENTAEFLFALLNNTSLKILDIRGNLMGDAGVRVLTHILQMNRHLHTIFFDRNLLTLNNLEDIVNSMEENYVIHYLHVPITDIILMKTSEKDRMEKLQLLMTKLDSICTRNQQQKENISSTDSLLITTAANLSREMHFSWENQQQLVGDQASLEYMLSCSNRSNGKNDDLNSLLTRTAHITKLATELHDLYTVEEQRVQDEWNAMCKLFEQKLIEKNERLSRKFYQLFKEKKTINYDDKFHEQIRTFFSDSNDNNHHLLNEEIPVKLASYSRECYINVATCLQKRAYDTTNDVAIDMHKQLESTIFHLATSSQQTSVTDGQQHAPSSTLDRLVSRGANVVHRLGHKQSHAQAELIDEMSNNRQIKKADSNECLTDPSPKMARSTTKDNRLLTAPQSKGPTPPAPLSPKPASATGYRRSLLINSNEQESVPSATTDAIYSNVSTSARNKKNEIPVEDEGDLIEHDLLDLVEQEQQKEHQQQQRNIPPAIPLKKRMAPVVQENTLDIEMEPTMKLAHPSKDRPRRANVKRPVRRATNGASRDSSSDGGLDNDDNSTGDIPSTSVNEISIESNLNTSSVDPQTVEIPSKTVKSIFKSALKTSKTGSDESSSPPPPVMAKPQPQLPVLQARSSTSQQQTPLPTSKSMTGTNNDSPQIINSDVSHELLQTKPSMSTSSYTSLTPTNKDEQKEMNNSLESITSPLPPVLARVGKAAIGPRVLPAPDPNGEAPPVKLRHNPPEKKVSLPVNSPSTTENPPGSDGISGATESPSDSNEQYKRLSVKERARMLTTTVPSMASNDKKTPPASATVPSQTSPYTPRTYRRLIEQVNLFC